MNAQEFIKKVEQLKCGQEFKTNDVIVKGYGCENSIRFGGKVEMVVWFDKVEAEASYIVGLHYKGVRVGGVILC